MVCRSHSQLFLNGEAELKYLKHLVDPEKTAIDVGANHGVYSYWLARYAGKTIACEPHPSLANYLESAFGDKIEVINAAISDTDGEITLSVPGATGDEQNYRGSIQAETVSGFADVTTYTVQMVTLDEIASKNVGFIKIDVEGHENAVLRGAKRLLSEDRPVILVEAEEQHRSNTVRDVREYLEQLDYAGFFCIGNSIRSIAEFDPLVHQNTSNDYGSEYINNLIFIPKEKSNSFINSRLAT